MKPDAAEHARIGEHKCRTARDQHQMVVFFRAVTCRLGPQFTAHAEMDAEPGAAAEAKEHLLGGRSRADESRAGELA